MWFFRRSSTVAPFDAFFGALGLDVFEQRGELGQRIVGADVAVKLAPVVDQIARNFQFLFADAIQRLDLAGVDDRRIQTGFNRVVQKN